MSGVRDILVVGLSHHTAPLEVREKLSTPEGGALQALRSMMEKASLSEGLLVSTCNRVELYGVAKDPITALEGARRAFSSHIEHQGVEAMLYERRGEEAVRHAFRVAASLDSMVLGEPQILGQLKQAFSTADGAGAVGTILGRCFHRAFAVAKRVRTETGLAAGTVSVSSIACDLARTIFHDLTGKRVLLVGAGKMSEAAARSLRKQGARLFVVNRSPERAQALAASYEGEPRAFEELAAELALADVVITSTASQRFILTPELLRGVMKARRYRPIFLIDIALPRDIDPRVAKLENVFLYDLDDLQKISQENLGARRKEADVAERIVLGEVAAFERWRRALDLTPTIVALRERFREVVRNELERTLPRLGVGEEERKSLDLMCDAMVNKLLHQPLTELKRGADGPDGAQLIDAARRLFDLEAAIETYRSEQRDAEARGREPTVATTHAIPAASPATSTGRKNG